VFVLSIIVKLMMMMKTGLIPAVALLVFVSCLFAIFGAF
jgi:hypothetical protein